MNLSIPRFPALSNVGNLPLTMRIAPPALQEEEA